MMPLAKRWTWLPLTGLAVVLALVLGLLAARAKGHDEAAYFGKLALLRHLQQLDAGWELLVLKSKMGMNSNYDPLTEHLAELNRLQADLVAALATPGEEGTAVQSVEGALDEAIREKAGLVEQFKSHNAVLRNSLAFLPSAADDIGAAPDRIAADVNQALLASLVYSQAASDDRAAEIRAALDRLGAARAGLPAATGEAVDIFILHVGTVLREHQAVNGLLAGIGEVPVADLVNAIHDLLSAEQRAVDAQAQVYRRYLVIFSALLIALLGYAAVSLIRSHGQINRVNGELQEANATLEQRVAERTRELRAAQDELVATARQAGMAEIATNVLHNVGNVLNSVNVSAGLVSSQVRASKAAGLGRAVRMMNDHAADLGDFLTRDEKGRMLPEYLAKLAEALAAEQQGMVDELAQLTRSIDHIKDIVATQQSYAGSSRMVEPIQIRELVEDALRMNAAALTRHEVTVVREFAEVPKLPLDRHRVLQILVNLISNAKHAMDGMAGCSHRLTLGVDLAGDGEGGGRRLRITVADAGEGIPAENLTRIFNHGFTTRQNGHGFGLHSCALAAREMGGTLTAHSDGPGRGAEFTLVLPIPAANAAGTTSPITALPSVEIVQ